MTNADTSTTNLPTTQTMSTSNSSATATATAAASSSSSSSLPAPRSPVGALARHQAAIAARQQEPKSWAEATQRYHSSRTAPAHPSLLSPSVPSKHGVFNRTLSPSAFNPVRGTYVNPSLEAEARQREEKESELSRERARYVRDHEPYHKGFDTLTGVTVPTLNREVAAQLAAADSAHPTKVSVDPITGQRSISFTHPSSHPPPRDYDIINLHMQFADSAARLAAEDAEAKRKIELRNSTKQSKVNVEKRDFDIIKQRYTEGDHDARVAAESAAAADELRRRYYRTSHYNPVQCVFTNPHEESRYQAERLALCASQGFLQQSALPPRIRRSEGQLYDIFRPSIVKDPIAVARYIDEPAKRARLSHARALMHERSMVLASESREEKQARRSYNRVSTRRYEEQIKRGTDIITNQPFNATSTSTKNTSQSTQTRRSSQPSSPLIRSSNGQAARPITAKS